MRTADSLINKILITEDQDDAKTIVLYTELNNIKSAGFITREQGIKILKWKSPRPLKHYQVNTEEDFKEISGLAFSSSNEKARMQILTALNGVNYPAASAILMFYDKSIYPIIDIRVWRQLYQFKLVNTNPKGQGFRLNEWIIYLDVIRGLAEQLNLTARQVEKRIFDIDRVEQAKRGDRLY